MNKHMQTFWKLLKESTITQAFITVVVILVYCYMLVTNQPVPDQFNAIIGLVIGFFFGGKMGFAQGTSSQSSQTKQE